jgi:uncharacterized protein
MSDISHFFDLLTAWADKTPNIIGIFLVGSHAHGTAHAKSDVDIVIITDKTQQLLQNDAWVKNFGPVRSITREDWGMVIAKRVFFESELEVEFGITSDEWLKTDPIDQGTKKALSDGYKILVDRDNALKKAAGLIVQT